MQTPPEESLSRRLRRLLVGAARSPHDRGIFRHLSLIAFFAWIGLGGDGLSSCSYGPAEAFRALGDHPHLGLFVALATGLTVFVIGTSYSQIIEVFPTGGGGYLVASKLLSPRVGMVSGCALLVDYVLTISVSVAAGAEALFNFFPGMVRYRLAFAVVVLLILTVLNMRGVKESILVLLPIFLLFVLTHAFAIVYALAVGGRGLGAMVTETVADVQQTRASLGLWGMIVLIMHAYSMGAGTYTGIEAVSNGLPVLREPKAQTGKRTMRYMMISLAATVVGLMVGYLLFGVKHEEGKTLNWVLMDRLTAGWPGGWGGTFVIVTLVSEAALLFVAAQTGFIGGPGVLSNMALDRWVPTRFSMLSDRLVTQNGVLLMGGAAVATMVLTGGAVEYLVVLYSINVFITFTLSQLGMVRHWWLVRRKVKDWGRRLTINGVGLAMTLVILCWTIVAKFLVGGYVTLIVTGSLVGLVVLVRRHYNRTAVLLRRLDDLARGAIAMTEAAAKAPPAPVAVDPDAKTAVLLVNGFNGMGVHSVLNLLRYFGQTFRNFVFIQIGVVDAGNFKGVQEVARLREHVETETRKYVEFVNRQGFYGEAVTAVGNDIVTEVVAIGPKVVERFPQSVFFAGQLVLPDDTLFSHWLHNNVVFAVQRQLYRQGIPFVILPIRV